MSQLVYLRTIKEPEAQIWYGPPYTGVMMLETNNLGNLKYPSLGGERLIKRIDIKDGEEALGIEALKKLYPLEEKTNDKS